MNAIPPQLILLPVHHYSKDGTTLLSCLGLDNLGIVTVLATDNFCKTIKIFVLHDLNTGFNFLDSIEPFKFLS